jgi:hypothetical protein
MRSSLRLALAFLLLALSFAAAAQSIPLPDLDQLEGKLGIRPDQKRQYDATIASTKRALLAAGLAAMQVKDAIAKEMAKKDPDYITLMLTQKDVLEQAKPLVEEAGREWDKLFKQLDDRQLRIARAWVRENLGKYFP